MHITAMGSAAVALVGAAVVLAFLPGRDAAAAAGGDKPERQTV
jgi:DHA2 family integral membrane protein (MFS transporter)